MSTQINTHILTNNQHAVNKTNSAYNKALTMSHPTKDDADIVYASELSILLKNLTVVSLDTLLSEYFPQSTAPPMSQTTADAFKTRMAPYKNKLPGESKQLYQDVKAALNICCPTDAPAPTPGDYTPSKPLRCFDSHYMQSETPTLTGNPTKRSPDLCLSFDDPTTKTLWATAAVNIEIKPEIYADCGFTAGNSFLTGAKDEPPNKLSKLQLGLLLQAFRYVTSQWPKRPYRWIWSITIAHSLLRIWRWSATGVLVTEAIHYLDDATPLYQFLQVIGRGPYSRLGLDIGHNMTFNFVSAGGGDNPPTTSMDDVAGAIQAESQTSLISSADSTGSIVGAVEGQSQDFPAEDIRIRMKQVIECYQNSLHRKDEQWAARAKESEIWSFTHRPVASIQPQVEQGKTNLYVVAHPIWCGQGIYSRGTRCYLAVYRSDLLEIDNVSIVNLHMFKTSWRISTRTPEHIFFAHFQANRQETDTHMAYMVSGGTVEGTLQIKGRFSPLDDSTRVEEGRQLDWVVLKQIGEHISQSRSVHELLQIVQDAMKAHQHLYEAGILHRDISPNNVLIALSANTEPRHGLLVDLDMARFAGPESPEIGPGIGNSVSKSLPEITGTLFFLSVAVSNRPFHRRWHDIESFYWLLIFIVLRHVPGMSIQLADSKINLDDPKNRHKALLAIFPNPPEVGNALETACTAKKQFILASVYLTFDSTVNDPLATLLNETTARFKTLYKIFHLLDEQKSIAEKLVKGLRLSETLIPFENIATACNIDDVEKQHLALLNIATSIRDSLAALKKGVTNAVADAEGDRDYLPAHGGLRVKISNALHPPRGSYPNVSQFVHWDKCLKVMDAGLNEVQRDIKELQIFPDYASFLDEIKMALEMQQGISPTPLTSYHPITPRDGVRILRKGKEEAMHSDPTSGESPFRSIRPTLGSASAGSGRGSKRKQVSGESRPFGISSIGGDDDEYRPSRHTKR